VLGAIGAGPVAMIVPAGSAFFGAKATPSVAKIGDSASRVTDTSTAADPFKTPYVINDATIVIAVVRNAATAFLYSASLTCVNILATPNLEPHHQLDLVRNVQLVVCPCDI